MAEHEDGDATRMKPGREPSGEDKPRPAARSARREGEEVFVEVKDMASRFPGDASSHGVRGMGGNVRDWTSTEGGGGRDTRVVRGGAWLASRLVSRCAYRNLYVPSVVNDYLGFRVVRGPRRTRP